VGRENAFPKGLSDNILARGKALYKGHAVAGVAATSALAAEEALALIEVEYEELPWITNLEDAIKAKAPVLHEHWPKNGASESGLDGPNVADHVQHPATLEAWRLLFVSEKYGNLESNCGVPGQAKEIHVHRHVRDRVDLNLTRQHLFGLITELQTVQARVEAAAPHFAIEFAAIDRYGNRVLSGAVDHAGDASGSARCPRSAATQVGAALCRNHVSIGHVVLLIQTPSPRPREIGRDNAVNRTTTRRSAPR